MLEMILNYFAEKNVSVPEGALLNARKTFFRQNVLLFFFNIQDFLPKNVMMWSQKGNFYCKLSKNPHAFFILLKKGFSVFNKTPSDTPKVFFFQQNNFFFFSTSMKSLF